MSIDRIVACRFCAGSRRDPRDGRRKCRMCRGSGRVWQEQEKDKKTAPRVAADYPSAVIVAKATCDRCGHVDLEADDPPVYDRRLFDGDIWCVHCRGGLVRFEFRSPGAGDE